MMKFATIHSRPLFLVIILALSISCEALADLGFFPPDSAKAPPAVQKAASSIFRLVNLGGKILPLATKDWATDYPAGHQVIQGNVDKGRLNTLEQATLDAQLNFCEQEKKEIADCNLMLGFEYSTAFITGNGTELWTTFHSLRHYLHLILKENMADFSPQNPINDGQIAQAIEVLKTKNLPIVLTDNHGQVGFDGSRGDVARLEFIEREAVPFLWSYDWQSAYTLSREDTKTIDYVKLKLSRSLGQGLPIETTLSGASVEIALPPEKNSESSDGSEKDSALYNTPLYIIGYPMETDSRHAYEAPDSDGESQYLTIGKRLDLEQLKARLNDSGEDWSRGLDARQAFELQGDIIAGDNDGVNRMSGSPLLDKNGKVLGVYQGSTDNLPSKTSFSASFKHILRKMAEK